MAILSGVFCEVGYFRWWPAILLTPLPLGFAFARCRSRWGCVWLGLLGGFVALRIQQDRLTVYNHVAANLLVFLNALTLIPVALAVYEGRRRGCRMAWVLPVAWVGAESLRMAGPFGWPFAVLAFGCHEQVWMIQTADLGGPMLISFAIAAANGALLDALLARGPGRARLRHALLPGGLAVAAAWGMIFGYGQFRIRRIDQTLQPGPRIAVLQSDALLFQDPAKNYDGRMLMQDLKRMSEEAARAPEPPDLILWPEKAADIPLFNVEFLQAEFHPNMVPEAERAKAESDPKPFEAEWMRFRQVRAEQQASFIQWVHALGLPVLAGLSDQRPGGGTFPNYFEERNAATLFVPGAGEGEDSQFKMRLFPGGEYIPGGTDAWLRWAGWIPPVRRWVESIGNLVAGEERVLMRMNGHPFVVAICSEILHSESAGVFAESPEGRQPLILTLANEGRFHRNHSILVSKMAMAFRAVEARTTVARATNAGVSGFVDPTGRYTGMVTNESGNYFPRVGAPDSVAIDALLAFRNEHGVEAIATDPALLAEHQRRVAEIERLRVLAGVQGFSIRNTSTTSGRTLYQRGGHHFPNVMSVVFILLVGFFLLAPHRTRQSSMVGCR
ncbi:MAG: apolipoprotein N-acyltransferase [Kiritimatiellae bacterium]|nr:apolipoprotein N-acyltransferase [Kiritimatiellia bacterium]